MKYYKISHDLTSKIVGSDYPQSWKFTKGYQKRVDNPNAIYALLAQTKSFHRVDFKPDLDGFVLSGRSKKTNFISTSTLCRLLMDEKAKQVLQTKCNLGDHEFYEAVLYVKNNPQDYYYLDTYYDIIPYIDFSKSIYYLKYIKENDVIPEEWLNSGFKDCETVLSIKNTFQSN